MRAKQRLVDLDELVDQVVEALLVIDVRARVQDLAAVLRISFQVLSEHLLQVFVKLLGILVLGEMLLVVLYQLLDLLLQLLI